MTFLSIMARADDGILTDPHVVHYHRAFHQRSLLNENAWRYNGPPDRPPRNYRPSRNDGIEGQPVTAGSSNTNLAGGSLRRARVYRPFGVVQVENRLHGHQVHAGFVISVQRPDVTPVTALVLAGAGDLVQYKKS